MNKLVIRIFYSKNVIGSCYVPAHGSIEMFIAAIKNKYRDYYFKII